MSTENKFKEFWINDDNSVVKFVFKCKTEIDSVELINPDIVHVIEIAALEQLKAHLDKVNSEYYEMKIAYKESLDKSRDEIKKIHSENETLRDNLAWWQCNPCESLKDQIQQLKSKLEIAKEKGFHD